MRIPTETGRRPLAVFRDVRAGWLRHWLLGLTTSLLLAAPGLAWTAQFKEAPGLPEEGKAGDGMILGVIHENTLFFVALGVFGVFWFLLGGGRKAKIGRKGH